MPNTPIFGWPYQALTDAPDGAALGEDLALAIEATLVELFGRGTTPWTPTWTAAGGGFALGAGSSSGSYQVRGDWVDVFARLVFSSSSGGSMGSGQIQITGLPAEITPTDTRILVGSARDVGTATHAIIGEVSSTGVISLWTAAGAAVVTGTVPFTAVTNDNYRVNGTFLRI